LAIGEGKKNEVYPNAVKQDAVRQFSNNLHNNYAPRCDQVISADQISCWISAQQIVFPNKLGFLFDRPVTAQRRVKLLG
jgi:hypothetical protein